MALRPDDIDSLILVVARALWAGDSPLYVRNFLRARGLDEAELELVYRAGYILFNSRS